MAALPHGRGLVTSPGRSRRRIRRVTLNGEVDVYALRKLMGLRSANDDGVVILRRLFHSGLPLTSAEVEWLTAIATADFIIGHEITHQVKAHAAAFPTFNRNARGLKHGHRHDGADLTEGNDWV